MGRIIPAVTSDTFPRLLIENARRFGEKKIAIREKDFGIWQSYSWAESLRRVEAMANGLASLGFQRGDKAVVVGDNRPELYWSMIAVQSLGGIPVPLYQDSIEREMEFVTMHAEARFALVEDQEQADKILNIKDNCKCLEHIVYNDGRGMGKYDFPYLLSMEKLEEAGREFSQKNPDFLAAEIEKGSEDDLAIICYTSGTTGQPKGVMLAHGSFIRSCQNLVEFEGFGENDSVMAYLPMAWVGDFFVSIGIAFVQGVTINCPESGATVTHDLREVGPTFFFAPPRIWENMLTTLMIRMEDAGWLKRRIFDFFTKHGMGLEKKRVNGQAISRGDRFLTQVGNVLVFGSLRDNLGMGRVRLAWTAGEAMGPDTMMFFRALGINLKQVYALTEAGIFVSVPHTDDVKPGTCGPPVPWVEVKIDETGEVIFKSEAAFVGYYKNEKDTKTTKQDGWVHTGDAGFIAPDGHLKIVDRAKDVGKLAGGSIFAPKYLENKLKFSPFIREAITVGMDRPYVSAIICIDAEAVGNWAERRSLSYTSHVDISQKPEVYELIREEVKRINRSLVEDDGLEEVQIKKFLILHKELDPDDEEITRTRKIRRGFIAEKYKQLIEAMFTNVEHVQVRAEVMFEDGRTGTVDADLKIVHVNGDVSQNPL